jgi:hypothetical protein
MQGGRAIVIQKRIDFWIQATSNVYNRRRSCSTIDSRDVPTNANILDNNMYVPLTSSPHSVFSLPHLLYMIADQGYNANKLYEYSKKVFGIDLVCHIKRYKSTSKKRDLSLYAFMNLKWDSPSTIRGEYPSSL